MFTIVCDRCKAESTGRDEFEAEQKFSNHTCANMRNLDDLPFAILRELAYGRITEDEAFAQADQQ